MKTEQLTAASLNKKFTPMCARCGASDVRTEAFAEWNPVTQTWKINELLDGNTVCAACGRDTELKWRMEK
jgi:ribosomal protein L37E